jgi:hypothetical protein
MKAQAHAIALVHQGLEVGLAGFFHEAVRAEHDLPVGEDEEAIADFHVRRLVEAGLEAADAVEHRAPEGGVGAVGEGEEGQAAAFQGVERRHVVVARLIAQGQVVAGRPHDDVAGHAAHLRVGKAARDVADPVRPGDAAHVGGEDDFAAGHLEPGVLGAAAAPLRHAFQAHAVPLQALRRAIRGAVVHHDDLETLRGIVLGPQGGDAGIHLMGAVEGGNDDGGEGQLGASLGIVQGISHGVRGPRGPKSGSRASPPWGPPPGAAAMSPGRRPSLPGASRPGCP